MKSQSKRVILIEIKKYVSQATFQDVKNECCEVAMQVSQIEEEIKENEEASKILEGRLKEKLFVLKKISAIALLLKKKEEKKITKKELSEKTYLLLNYCSEENM